MEAQMQNTQRKKICHVTRKSWKWGILPLCTTLLLTLGAQAEVRRCFSPQEKCDDILVKQITEAQKNLYIAIYSLTHLKITEAIIHAHERGMDVRVIVDNTQRSGKRSRVQELLEAGVEVRENRHSGKMHNKFIVIDGHGLITGSFNFTENAAQRNDENLLQVTEEPDAVNAYTQQFLLMWEDRNRFQPLPLRSPQITPPRSSSASGIVGNRESRIYHLPGWPS